MRIEKDWLGEMEIEDTAMTGIHTERAQNNFSIKYRTVNIELIRAYALVKKACAHANVKTEKLSPDKGTAIISACSDIYNGIHDKWFSIPAIQGGAGTSVNMNINEVIANAALEKLGEKHGAYGIISPLDHVNLSQSTNDTFPTAVKIAAIKIMRELVENIMTLQEVLQNKEREFSDIVKIGRTQLKDAVPIFLGDEFGAYSEAISRDRWRLYKAEERIRQINLGGTAVGTGIGAEPKFRFIVTEEIRLLTGYGLARAENLIDNTQNLDSFVEVSGLLKTLAVNLNKIAGDLRLMDSGPNGGIGEIKLPPLQTGSSIMAGKINPVGAELIKQIYYKVSANDMLISMASADGEFELNANLPVIADALLESLEILRDGTKIFADKVIKGIEADRDKCRQNLEKSWSVAAVAIDRLGYEKLAEILKEAVKTGRDYRDLFKNYGIHIEL